MKKLFIVSLALITLAGCHKDESVKPFSPKSGIIISNLQCQLGWQLRRPHGRYQFGLSFMVTAYGATQYMPADVRLITKGSVDSADVKAMPAIEYTIDNGQILESDDDITGKLYCGEGPQPPRPDHNGNYVLPVGKTMEFTIKMITNQVRSLRRPACHNASPFQISSQIMSNGSHGPT